MWQTQIAEQAAAGSPYYPSDPEKVARSMIELVPLRRYGSATEVASVVGFLLSEGASYLTGVNIEVCGGSV
jgi:NAD(P)-dependent dehydrogenase (short-subunit alcohol dehydrogenase family)